MVIYDYINNLLGYFMPSTFTLFEKMTIFFLSFGVFVYLLKKVGVIN